MKRHLFIISAASFLLLAPTALIYGAETFSSTGSAIGNVHQENQMSDEHIKVAVQNAIASDVALANFVQNVHVTVDKGVVTLNGVVTSHDAKSKIESKVKGVMGVQKVENKLEVKEVKSE